MGKRASRLLYGTVTAVLLLMIMASALVAADKASGPGCGSNGPGFIDLTSCSYGKGFTARLDGEWELHWNQLLKQEDLVRPDKLPQPELYKVPRQWMPALLAKDGTGGHGYGTYRLRVLLPETGVSYGIKLNNARTASRLYIDGRLAGESGVPGDSPQSASPMNRPYEVYFVPQVQEVELLVQVSNYSYISGGISEPVYLGDYSSIAHLASRNSSYDLGIAVCLVVIACFFVGQSLQRNRERGSLFLALFASSTALYTLTHSEKLLFGYIPGLDYEIFSKLQAISGFVGFWGLAGYIHYIIPYMKNKAIYRWTGVAAGILIAVVLSVDAARYEWVAYAIPVEGLIVSSYAVYGMVKGIRARMQGSLYLLAGMLAFIQFICVQAVNLAMEGDPYSIPPVGIPVFVLAQSLFLSSRYNAAYRANRALSKELKRKDREKDRFLANTSRELRKPLQAIEAVARSIADEGSLSATDNGRENLQFIGNTARRLSFLVQDIVNYEQIRHGNMELESREIDAAPVADMVLELFRHLSREGSIVLENGIAPGVCVVVADGNRLAQILHSMTDAACRHAEAGVVRLFAEPRSEGMAGISVEYQGRSFQPDRLETALYGLEQKAEMLDTDYGESILGLRIASQLAAMHHGSLEFRQEKDRIGRYTVVLPGRMSLLFGQQEERTEMQEASASLQNRAGGKSKLQREAVMDKHPYRVLLVDDDYVHVKTLSSVLQAQGYEVSVAGSGRLALERIAVRGGYDLCIIQLRLPDMPGLSLCRSVRESLGPLDLPVLLSASHTHAGMHEAAVAAGANGLIQQPYEWDDVKARIRTLVQLKRMVSQLLDSEIAMLRAQIKPHFLYNAINTIIWMSKRDMEKCRQLLRDLSQFLRGSFDFANREAMVAFSTELELTGAYLSLEQARFGERLSVELQLESTDFMIPPLMVQPIVENAVRHGITQQEEGGTVSITVKGESRHWEITVADDGVGIAPEEAAASLSESGLKGRARGTGIGLANINRRLVRQFGQPLLIRPRAGGGTEVIIRIPREEEM